MAIIFPARPPAGAYVTNITNPNTDYWYLNIWPLALHHTNVVLPDIYVQVRNIGNVELAQEGIAQAWDFARDAIRRENDEGIIGDTYEANQLFLYQFRSALNSIFPGKPIVATYPFQGITPITVIRYIDKE